MRAREIEQTRASFDYQWSRLPPAEWSLANPEFRERVATDICSLCGLAPEWFAGRSVLDAGCGTGRFAYGFCRLGARVTAIDRSAIVLRTVQTACGPFEGFAGAIAADLLTPLPLDQQFDLVWSYGVLHHTGDTRTAFGHVARHVAPGGYLLVMLYGAPRSGQLDDYRRAVSWEAWRCRCREMSFDEKAAALGPIASPARLLEHFDTISPWINDRHSFDEVQAWFTEEGFVNLRRPIDDMDLYLVAQRAG